MKPVTLYETYKNQSDKAFAIETPAIKGGWKGDIGARHVGISKGGFLRCHGARNVHLEDIWSDGLPDSYFLLTADNPIDSFFWDNSANQKKIRQGQKEAAVRWMQCRYAHVIGLNIVGSWHTDASGHKARWKQAAQIRPMGPKGSKFEQFIAENWTVDGVIDIGNITDKNDKNYPFGTYDRVRLVGCKMAGYHVTFGVKLIEIVDCVIGGKLTNKVIKR